MNNPDVYFVDCSCHITHNAARKWGDSFSGSSGFDVEDSRKWGDSFSGSSGFDVEDLVVDLYYWFDKSTKRKNELNEFCVFSGNTTVVYPIRNGHFKMANCTSSKR